VKQNGLIAFINYLRIYWNGYVMWNNVEKEEKAVSEKGW